jgi:hypothetical protein
VAPTAVTSEDLVAPTAEASAALVARLSPNSLHRPRPPSRSSREAALVSVCPSVVHNKL